MCRTRLGIQSCWRLRCHRSRSLPWGRETWEERGGWCDEVGESFHDSCGESEEGEWGKVEWTKTTRMKMRNERFDD